MKFTVDAINLFKLAFLMLIMLFLLEGIQAQQICNRAVQVTSSCYQNQTNAGSPKEFDKHGNLFAFGPEKIYKLIISSTTNLQVGLEIPQKGLDLDLFLITFNCSTNIEKLLKYSIDDNTKYQTEFIQYNNLTPGVYYVVVDGAYSNSIGNFNIDFTFGALNCSNSELISCGSTINSTTIFSSNNNSVYEYQDENIIKSSGKEKIFRFNLPSINNISLTLTIKDPKVDLDLFLLSNCSSNITIGYSLNPAGETEKLSITDLPAGTYYVVVDGYNCSQGDFTLKFETNKCPKLITQKSGSATGNSIALGGIISSDGGCSISRKGLVWDTKPNPTLALSSSSNAGVGNTSFVNTITSLLPGTKYFARAYFTNCYGTIYGDELCFYTANPIIGLKQVCSGVEVVYSVKPMSGVVSYNWTLPPGWIARTSLTGNEIRVVPNTNTGKISVSAVNDCQNTSFTSQDVIVSAGGNFGALPNIIGNTSVCQKDIQLYSINPVAGATSYIWEYPPGWAPRSGLTSNSISLAPGSTGGRISVRAVNSCGQSGSASITVNVVNLSTPPLAIVGSRSVCSGTSQTYTCEPVNGATSYIWNFPVGWQITSGLNTNKITVVPNNTGGNISLRSVNSCGESPIINTQVTVNLNTSNTINLSGPIEVCSGVAQIYTATQISGVTNYNWILPTGWVFNSDRNKNRVVVIPNEVSGTVMVSANNTCGSSLPSTLVVEVASLPKITSEIIGVSDVCAGQSRIFSVSADGFPTSFEWKYPKGWLANSLENRNRISLIPDTTSGELMVRAVNFCGVSNVKSHFIKPAAKSLTPGPIRGSTNVCTKSTQIYFVDRVNGVGVNDYMWVLPEGWLITNGANTNRIIVITGKSGEISVRTKNSCSFSEMNKLLINVNESPGKPSIIAGNIEVCDNTSQIYSVNNIQGASFEWRIPNGWQANTSLNNRQISVVPKINGGILQVTAKNECGTSLPSALNINLNTIPAKPGNISGSLQVCEGKDQVYSTDLISNNVKFNWIIPSGWTKKSGDNTNSIVLVPNAQSGILRVNAFNICGSSPESSLNINTQTIPIISGSILGEDTICANVSKVFSVNKSNNASAYFWKFPDAWIQKDMLNNHSVEVVPNDNSGIVSVVANNFCGNSMVISKNIVVFETPKTPVFIEGNNKFCEGVTQSFKVARNSNNESYIWNYPKGWNLKSDKFGNSITLVSGSDLGSISVRAKNKYCTSKETSIILDVFPKVDVFPTYVLPSCTKSNGEISLNISGGTKPYNIRWLDSLTQSTSSTRKGIPTGDYEVEVIDANACKYVFELFLNKPGDCEDDFVIYTSFTPNGDGINQFFEIVPTKPFDSNYLGELIILNRWSEIVYKSKLNIPYDNSWQGHDLKGNELPQGVYYYLFKPYRNENRVLKGFVTLLRE
jgi:gliding motility-associated-like protein